MDFDKVNAALDQCAETLSDIANENQFILAAGTVGEDEAVSMRVRCDTMPNLGVMMTAMISEISAYQEWKPEQLMQFLRQLITAVVLSRWGEEMSADSFIKRMAEQNENADG